MKLSRNSGKVFWGLVLVAAAAWMIVSKYFTLPISIFKIILTVFLVSVLIKGVKHVNFSEILFPLAFLCILYDELLGITALTPWTVLGAALLGSIGLSMIFKPKNHYKIGFEGQIDLNDDDATARSEQYTGEKICFENNFGSSIKYITSDNFLKGDFENNFGSLVVYFDNAIIQAPTATVYVENNFGETKLFIPKEWKVINNLGQSFGEVKVKGENEGTSTHTLVIEGEVNFGEIRIQFI